MTFFSIAFFYHENNFKKINEAFSNNMNAEHGLSAGTMEITAKEAVVIGFENVKAFIDEPLLIRVSSTDADDSPTINSGLEGKRRSWNVQIGNKDGDKWTTYQIVNKRIVDIHGDDALNYNNDIYFMKGKHTLSDIVIDSDKAVGIAIDKKNLSPGNPEKPENWLVGYHFNIGDVIMSDNVHDTKLVIMVSGISPNGNLARITIDMETGEIIGAGEQTGYDEDGHSIWEPF